MPRRNQPCDFWAKVTPGPVDCCWEYTGCLINRGYGRISFRGVIWKAHRLAFYLANGYISKALCIRHSCDNPACCNPAHLFLGTNADNMQDKVSRNRQAKGVTHGRAKLTESQVLEIKALLAAGHNSHRLIAKQFGISHHCVEAIKYRRNWKHLAPF